MQAEQVSRSENLDQMLLTANKFVRSLLGCDIYESNPEVLEYLVKEADAHLYRQKDLAKLRSLRQTLRTELESEALALRTILNRCGVDVTDSKFGAIDVASQFADSTREPDILNLLLAYTRQAARLNSLGQMYDSLSHIDQDLRRILRQVVDSRGGIPEDVLLKLVEETDIRSKAARSIEIGAEQDRSELTSERVPILDIKTVMQQHNACDEISKELANREAHLQSFASLPPDLDQVLLENDRMQRRLEQLNQQRKDVFRSIRHH